MQNMTEKLLTEIRAERSKLPPGKKEEIRVPTTAMVRPSEMQIQVINRSPRTAVLPVKVRH